MKECKRCISKLTKIDELKERIRFIFRISRNRRKQHLQDISVILKKIYSAELILMEVKNDLKRMVGVKQYHNYNKEIKKSS
jgi:hypothetical protein